MRKKGIAKKISAIFLSVAMVVTLIPSFSAPAFAQSTANVLPDKTQFATAEELKTFDTNDQNGKNPAKVYFGNNSQQWWIAGSQHGNLTLFAASPLATGRPFEPNSYSYKNYNSNWGCTYPNGNPQKVPSNHYGSSTIRNTLKSFEAQYFTGSEQSLMNITTIYTNDMEANSVYSTNDKLYLAHTPNSEGYGRLIIVGANSANNLNDGLQVAPAYCVNNEPFWLRTACTRRPYLALHMNQNQFVDYWEPHGPFSVMPAFEFDMSTVLFGAAASAASANGSLQTNDAFTLRYDASKYNKNLGSALVSLDKNKVKLTDVPAGTYLVAQNKAGAKAVEIKGKTVTAMDMGLDNFENCKVWLETTDNANRMTYATLATEEEAAASVGDKQYASLQEALNNAKANDTVVLLKDITLDGYTAIDKSINFDLNGKTLNLDIDKLHILENVKLNVINNNKGDIAGVRGSIASRGILTTKDSLSCYIETHGNGIIENGTYSGEISNFGIINNGTYTGYVSNYGTINNGTYSSRIDLADNAVINGGTFGEEAAIYGQGTINGGEFYSRVSLSGPDFLPSYKGIINGGSFAQKPEFKHGAKIGDGKVLIETTNTKLPYKVIDKANVATLDVTIGNNLTHESGELNQVGEKNVEIQPLIINVADGYYLSDSFVDELKAKGLSVTREGSKVTISGALKDDLTIALKATKKVNGNTAVVTPKGLTAIYKEGLTLKDVELPKGWSWSNPDTPLSAGTKSYEAVFDTATLEDTHDFTGVEGYDPNTHTITRNVEVNVKVSSTPAAADATKTGDPTNLGIFAGLLVLSALAMAALAIFKKKRITDK